MTDYNDGKWHGSNGGECPVDPASVISCVYKSCSTDETGQYASMDTRAAIAPWTDVIAFRVTKPAPPKPREWWCVMDTARGKNIPYGWSTSRKGAADMLGADSAEIIHVREVLPE